MKLRAPARLAFSLVLVAGCGGGDDGAGASGSAAATTSGGQGGAGGASTGTGEGGDLTTVGTGAGTGGSGQGGGLPVDVCVGIDCPDDQHCADVMGVGTCVDNTCADLMCSATEECQSTAGGGALCVDISCISDADCNVADYCNGTICVDDACVKGTRKCVGDVLFECSANGFAFVVQYTCGSQAYFTSTCVEDGAGDAWCGCEDDWDCPGYTACESGICVGTGDAPTCSLPPEDFTNVLPVNEILWGGTGTAAKSAVNSPFPSSSQVSVVPIVANLDDDNGDGKVDELDFPEIVFMSYCNSDVTSNGIVRAIHGGGPNKGKDAFATCGSTVWHEGDDIAMACACSAAEGNSVGTLAVGDLDYDGLPEIVVPNETQGFTILDRKGVPITSVTGQWATYNDAAITLANLDEKGFVEIVVGRDVFQLDHDANGLLTVVNTFDGALNLGMNGQGPVSCVADIAGGAEQEIIAGTTAYRMPTPPAGVTTQAACPVGAVDNFCKKTLEVVWDGQAVNGAAALPNAQKDGFCAVADVLGTDPVAPPSPSNPLDQKPEVVVIGEGYVLVLEGATGTLRRSINLNLGADGGAPNVDDFDGDGFPEIGSALGTAYVMLDLQATSAACPAWPNTFSDAASGLQGNPARTPGGACVQDADCAAGAVCSQSQGQCVCLHNGWLRGTEDNSSRVTSSSVFDFNGDGAAEVVYNDECHFRIYDGKGADVLFKNPSPSRTRVENPAIADVDNDGNAEIVFPSNNESAQCSTGVDYPNGIAVWGDASDSWVSARRIWNQHAYHVTNVTESGMIPLHEPESWRSYNGRVYNTYRSNPRNYNVAPDLTVSGIQVASPDATCGQLSLSIDITAEIENQGDLRVGPGIVLTYYGVWTGAGLTEPLYVDAAQTPLSATLQGSLEPGDSILVTASYSAQWNSPGVLPDKVRVVVDEADQASECVEINNELESVVDPGMLLADLVLVLGDPDASACPMPTIPSTVTNQGSAAASNIVVRYYAGDPNQGGAPLVDVVVAGPLNPGDAYDFTAIIPALPNSLPTLIHGVVDPDDLIPECKDGNNEAAALSKVTCSEVN
jgi:hypothetical protein